MVVPRTLNDMLESEPLRLLGCQGLEILNWVGGQLQHMHDELLAEDILRGSEGAPDAMRDKILAELFGYTGKRSGTCCNSANDAKASPREDAEQKLPQQPQEEQKATESQAEDRGKGTCPGRRNGLGLAGWLNEQLTKMEEELYKNEPSTSDASQADIRVRVAEKLRNQRREQNSNDREETKETQVKAENNRETCGSVSKPEKKTSAKVALNEENHEEVQRENPATEALSKDKVTEKTETESRNKSATISIQNESHEQQMTSKPANDEGNQKKNETLIKTSPRSDSDIDLFTPRRVDLKQFIEWHFGGDSWLQPEDVKIDVDGRKVSLVVCKKETGHLPDAAGEAETGEFSSYREVRQVLILPETVDASKLTARYVPESRTVVLCAPRVLKHDNKDEGLVPIKIIRKNQINPSN